MYIKSTINFMKDIIKKIYTIFLLILVGFWILCAFLISFTTSFIMEQFKSTEKIINIIKIIIGIISIYGIGLYTITFFNHS